MDEGTIKKGLRTLAELDTDLALAADRIGLPPARKRPAGFETLLSTIISQQISSEAARSITARIAALLPDMSADALLQLDTEVLRQAGLSYRKIEYAQGLASAIVGGEFDVDGLAAMTDQAAIASITALRGFGPWSAEIYLMFSLNRRDIFPAGDLALQTALGRLKGLEKRPAPAQARALVAHWSPWRSVGSLFLWHYYRGAPQ